MKKQAKKNVFLAYAKKDLDILKKLLGHLSGLVRSEEIDIWYDEEIEAGDTEKETLKQLNKADFILLLISSDFLASDHCYNFILKNALKRAASSKVKLIPVLARECDWEMTPLAKFKALPNDEMPLESAEWGNKDRPYKVTSKGLRTLISGKAKTEDRSRRQKRKYWQYFDQYWQHHRR